MRSPRLFLSKGCALRRLLLPLFFGILGTAVLLWLGFWQVSRLDWKEGVLAEIEARMADAPVAIPALPTEDVDQFLAVTATGQISDQEVHVLASSKKTGAIYRVVSAFTLDDGRRVLLDRGWIKPPAKDIARAPVQATITGNLLWPDERDSYTPENDVAGNIWFARDIDQLSEVLSTEPVLVITRGTDETNPVVTPMPVSSTGIPNDHLQYAVTWFGLALIWVVMTLYYLRRMRTEKKVLEP